VLAVVPHPTSSSATTVTDGAAYTEKHKAARGMQEAVAASVTPKPLTDQKRRRTVDLADMTDPTSKAVSYQAKIAASKTALGNATASSGPVPTQEARQPCISESFRPCKSKRHASS
jgi:hypothetical protein